ncbi:MAG: hypothetical protein DRI57_14730 [Deltaproteobacteria bacterium]|nr:MAG: hypothetical protein DRI57_14730 [Deltaproteobacteria bacterium]
MLSKPERVLLLYTDRYYLVKQVYPFGLDIIANALRHHGYDVTIACPFLTGTDTETGLEEILTDTAPDVIGLGIRNLDTTMSCEPFGNFEGHGYRTFYFLPEIRCLADIIRSHAPGIPVIVGGGGFTISPAAILKELGLEYGVVGEGEIPLLQFLEAFPDQKKIAEIPGMVLRQGDNFQISSRSAYAFPKALAPMKREKRFNYAYETAGLPVQVKRGCNQHCSYCVEPQIEGGRFIFRAHDEIIRELEMISQSYDEVRKIFFVDTEFNLPDLSSCSTLIRKIIGPGLHERFRFSSQFLPNPFDAEFAELLAASGFSIILTCDSFSDPVLEKNRSSHRQRHIATTLGLCEQFGIDCTVNLIFGLPGESHATLDHTIGEMMKFPPNAFRRYEYTMGGRVYQGTPLSHFVETRGDASHIYGKKTEGFLEPCYYCSPESPMKLKAYIENALPFSADYQNHQDTDKSRSLALAYLIDQEKWEDAAIKFSVSDIDAQTFMYDYFFRKVANSGETGMAKQISQSLAEAICQNDQTARYGETLSLIQYYLSILGALP